MSLQQPKYQYSFKLCGFMTAKEIKYKINAPILCPKIDIKHGPFKTESACMFCMKLEICRIIDCVFQKYYDILDKKYITDRKETWKAFINGIYNYELIINTYHQKIRVWMEKKYNIMLPSIVILVHGEN